jgi:hypothetical protein
MRRCSTTLKRDCNRSNEVKGACGGTGSHTPAALLSSLLARRCRRCSALAAAVAAADAAAAAATPHTVCTRTGVHTRMQVNLHYHFVGSYTASGTWKGEVAV